MNYPNALVVLKLWISNLNARNPNKAAGLYAEHSVLLPTFSPRALRTSDDRYGYLLSLARRPNLGVSLHENTFSERNQRGTAVAEGIYFFEFDVDGESLRFEARFSLMMDLASPRPILLHHSSQVPRGLA